MEKLGANLVADQGIYQWVEIGGLELLFRPGTGTHSGDYKDSEMVIVLYIDDAAKFKNDIESKGVLVTHGDNDECLTFQDSDGHWIQAVQN